MSFPLGALLAYSACSMNMPGTRINAYFRKSNDDHVAIVITDRRLAQMEQHFRENGPGNKLLETHI